MKGMNSIAPPMPTPRSAEDMAFFEMNGTRYLVMPLGPAPSLVAEGRKATQMPIMPAPAPTKDAEADVAPTTDDGSTPKKYVYGLKGIQELFNCSKSTAYNIKRSGRIDAAISQIGNTIIVDAEKALALLKK